MTPTNLETGLTNTDVQQRIAAGQQNDPAPALTRSVKRIFSDNLLTWFNLINVLLAALVFFTGSYKNMLFFGVAFFNTAIGIFQEIRSKRQIDKMSFLSEATYQLKREGKLIRVHQDAIVKDDLIMLSRGDQLPVDAHIVSTQGLEVDESQITGESTPIAKQVGDSLTSGSFLVSGQAVAQVTGVGSTSFIRELSSEVKTEHASHSQLLDTINRIIKILTIVIVPLGAALFISKMVNGNSLNTAILGTVAGMVGMIPEGLVLLTSVSLAVSAMNLARRHVLVRELPAIEGLARVDVLCLDKTGTITSGKLKLDQVVPLGNTTSTALQTDTSGLIHAIGDENETATALKDAWPNPNWTASKVMPFSSARKWSGAVFETGAYVLGAPEFILPEPDPELQKRVHKYASEGYRVLFVAQVSQLTADDLGTVTPMGLVLITDELRENATNTFAYFANQDVALKVISGDNPTTVASIASRAGIANCEHLVDMSTLEAPIDYDHLVATYTVFGRVTPTQKRELVKAWQRADHTVAMTGDGVNDILALRQADCGIAMASGSEATKSIADFVLIDSNFDAMLNVLNEGRRVVNNIERVAALYLIKTMYSVSLSLIFVFMASSYPFQPIQLTPISMFTVGIPSFFLALEPNHERLSGQFMKQVMVIAAPAAICIVSYIMFVFLVGGVQLQMPYVQTSTLSVMMTGAVGFMALLMCARPLNRMKIGLVAIMLACFILVFVFFGHLFSLSSIFNFRLAMFYLPLLVSVYPFFYVVQELLGKRLFSRIRWR